MSRASKPMGLGAMFVLFAAVIIVLPMVIRFIAKVTGENPVISGFRDGSIPAGEERAVPEERVYASQDLDAERTAGRDPNTVYTCRKACPEGQFCSGINQECLQKTLPGDMDEIKGYYA